MEKMADVTLFESDNWNFLKIAQHAFTYANNQDTSKLLSTRWDKPLWLLKVIFRVKRLKNRGVGQKLDLAPTLFLEEGRYSTDHKGIRHSVYFEKILAFVPENERTVLHLASDASLDNQHTMDHVKTAMGAAVMDERLSNMISECQVVVHRFENHPFSDSEKHYFASAMHIFIEEFATYNTLFANQGVKKCFFCTHYHREGMIAAAMVHGIEMIELQHGLIAENDLYYVYPDYVKNAKNRAFFPEKLLLFGDYWRDVVLRGAERRPEDCLTMGDYSYSTERPDIEKSNTIFIGAQKNMAQPYADYANRLLKKIETDYPDWKIKLKMHPLEKQINIYKAVDHPQFELIGNEGDLHTLLAECRIQISIYSTTFFDSLGMDVVNMSLQNYTEFSDYAKDMITENVAFPLEVVEDPIALYRHIISSGKRLLSRDSVYAPFDEKALQRVLK